MSPFRLAGALQVELPVIEVLDIGARQEDNDCYASLLEQGLAQITGFEPEPSEFQRLKSRPGPFAYHPDFLGDGNPATLHVTHYPGCSSLLDPDPAVIDLFEGIGASSPGGNFHVLEKVPVQTTRLDDIREIAPPDYIKIDVQGAELTVLKHGTRTLSSATVVQTEVEFLPLYKGQPLFGDMQCFFREQGFVLHKLIDISGRTFRPLRNPEHPYRALSQVLWADAVFVRDFTDFSRWSLDDLLKAALILTDVYNSYDLALLYLREHDLRTKGDLSKKYASMLSQTEIDRLYFNCKDTI